MSAQLQAALRMGAQDRRAPVVHMHQSTVMLRTLLRVLDKGRRVTWQTLKFQATAGPLAKVQLLETNSLMGVNLVTQMLTLLLQTV